jgi:hypothetical protein
VKKTPVPSGRRTATDERRPTKDERRKTKDEELALSKAKGPMPSSLITRHYYENEQAGAKGTRGFEIADCRLQIVVPSSFAFCGIHDPLLLHSLNLQSKI